MQRKRWLPLALVVAMSSACYHQIVNTGLAPGTLIVQHTFVSTWAWGLVPAKDIDVRRECPFGIARIESKQSVVNGIIAYVTFGIYTPRNVKITCAASSSGLSSPFNRNGAAARATALTETQR